VYSTCAARGRLVNYLGGSFGRKNPRRYYSGVNRRDSLFWAIIPPTPNEAGALQRPETAQGSVVATFTALLIDRPLENAMNMKRPGLSLEARQSGTPRSKVLVFGLEFRSIKAPSLVRYIGYVSQTVWKISYPTACMSTISRSPSL
jgi:hypothetical protein